MKKLEEMTKKELLAEAEKLGVKLAKGMTKADILGVIAKISETPLSGPGSVIPTSEPESEPAAMSIQHDGSKGLGLLERMAKAGIFVYHFIAAGVPDDDLAACYEWAFGYGWESFITRRVCSRWNEQHSDIFHIEFKNYGQKTAPLMERIGRAYLEKDK